MAGIWVYAEHKDGKVKKVTFEILNEAKKLAEKKGEKLCAILIGSRVEEMVPAVGSHGAEKIYCVEADNLGTYTTRPSAIWRNRRSLPSSCSGPA
jgi:electron transfer flavoprotein alpha subunit